MATKVTTATKVPMATKSTISTKSIKMFPSRFGFICNMGLLSLKMMVKSGLEFILKLTEPLQSCCCPVQKYLPRLAELAWQLSRYLWMGSVNFKINSRPLFTIIFKLKNDNFQTRDFSPLIERVLAGVSCLLYALFFNPSKEFILCPCSRLYGSYLCQCRATLWISYNPNIIGSNLNCFYLFCNFLHSRQRMYTIWFWNNAIQLVRFWSK